VSVVSGLQALKALDQERFDAFPVYVSTRGEWFVGEPLATRGSFLPGPAVMSQLTEVVLDLGARSTGRLLPRKTGIFSRTKPVEFDVALLAFHGADGEDGNVQGLFETANVPYTGMRTLACAVLMDKVATKRLLAGLGIPLLPMAIVGRPATGYLPDPAVVAGVPSSIAPPWCVKPVHLGSSIGVAKVDAMDELRSVLGEIFKLDSHAMIEPFVPNLVEFNVAVSAFSGSPVTSAIETPKRTAELLDFREKYMSGGGKKGGSKAPGDSSQGMLSLTRTINPDIDRSMADNIRRWALQAFEVVNGTGAPRIDFLSNGATGEVWLNELNPCPGSFGFYLWEAADPPLLFSPMLSSMIDEAESLHRSSQLADDPVPFDARLFPRR
jgi:D-alanine-D-alanine ligase